MSVPTPSFFTPLHSTLPTHSLPARATTSSSSAGPSSPADSYFLAFIICFCTTTLGTVATFLGMYLWHRNFRRHDQLDPEKADMYGCPCCKRGPTPEGLRRKISMERELAFVGVRSRTWFGYGSGSRLTRKKVSALDAAAAAAAVPDVEAAKMPKTHAPQHRSGLRSLQLVDQWRAAVDPGNTLDPFESARHQRQQQQQTNSRQNGPQQQQRGNVNGIRNSLSMFATSLSRRPPSRGKWPSRLDSHAQDQQNRHRHDFCIERGHDFQINRGVEPPRHVSNTDADAIRRGLGIQGVEGVEMQALAGNAAPMGSATAIGTGTAIDANVGGGVAMTGQARALALLEGRDVPGAWDWEGESERDRERMRELAVGAGISPWW